MTRPEGMTTTKEHRKQLTAYLPLPHARNTSPGASSSDTTPTQPARREDSNPSNPPNRTTGTEGGLGEAERGGPRGGMRMVVMRWRGRGKSRVVLPLLKFGCQRCMQTMKQRYHRHFLSGAVGSTRRRCCQVSHGVVSFILLLKRNTMCGYPRERWSRFC